MTNPIQYTEQQYDYLSCQLALADFKGRAEQADKAFHEHLLACIVTIAIGALACLAGPVGVCVAIPFGPIGIIFAWSAYKKSGPNKYRNICSYLDQSVKNIENSVSKEELKKIKRSMHKMFFRAADLSKQFIPHNEARAF